MRISIIVAILILLAGCNEGQHTKQQTTEKTTFFDSVQQRQLAFLDSLHLLQLNDTAKWFLYALQCDDSSKSGRAKLSKELPKMPLGFMQLNLNYAVKQKDTLSLLYNFLYDDSTIVEKTTLHNSLIEGVQYDIKKNKLIGYILGEGVYSQGGDPTSRYENPLQPEVIAFIKNNKDKLNPWFREEAKRRKIVE